MMGMTVMLFSDVAFRNLVYNLYSRDLSAKVKSAVKTRMKRGEFLGPFGIFGYEKSGEDIHKLVIDREAADIVRRIFLMIAEGVSRKEVVRRLNEEGVPTPAVYKQRKGCTRDWDPECNKGGWNTSKIARIIRMRGMPVIWLHIRGCMRSLSQRVRLMWISRNGLLSETRMKEL